MPNDITVIVNPAPTQNVVVDVQGAQTVTTAGPTVITTTSTSTETVSVQELGIVGPQGPQGPAGIGAPLMYPLFAVSSWTQAHSFAYLPEVRLVDQSNEEVEIGVEYPDATTVSISFPQPFTGTIYLS